MSWRKLHFSLAECGSAFSLSVCDGMLEAELRAAVAARLGALAGCERAATDLSWYLTLDGGDGAVVPLSPALPDGTRLLLQLDGPSPPRAVYTRDDCTRMLREAPPRAMLICALLRPFAQAHRQTAAWGEAAESVPIAIHELDAAAAEASAADASTRAFRRPRAMADASGELVEPQLIRAVEPCLLPLQLNHLLAPLPLPRRYMEARVSAHRVRIYRDVEAEEQQRLAEQRMWETERELTRARMASPSMTMTSSPHTS